jgi:hypothetical protein
MDAHWIWWLLTIACVAWYSTITVYVAIRGSCDIKSMLANLAKDAPAPDEEQRRG